jgi:hypothetical protein
MKTHLQQQLLTNVPKMIIKSGIKNSLKVSFASGKMIAFTTLNKVTKVT